MAPGNMTSMKLAHSKKCAEEELKKRNYGKAADRYSAAISLLQPAKDPGQLRLLYSNRSLALLKAGKAEAALQDAAAAVQLAPRWPKGHWRAGKALADMKRWPEALGCFLAAWQRAEQGSTEQKECEQQMEAAVKQLTRQQLADMLINHMQQQQQRQQQSMPGGHALITTAAVPLQQQQAQSSTQPPTANSACVQGSGARITHAEDDCDGHERSYRQTSSSIVTYSGSSCSSVVACSSSSSILHPGSWQQQEELREAMFQLVKAAAAAAAAAQPGRHMLLGLGCYQAMLLRWLKADSSSSSKNSPTTDVQQQQPQLTAFQAGCRMSAAVMEVEVSLLCAKLAVNCQQWAEAQHTAASAEQALQHMALPDQGHLLQLLLECYLTLGDAYMAAGSSNSSRRVQQQQQLKRCNPSAAAKAYLAALNFMPDRDAGRSTAALCPMFGDLAQLHSRLQSKLNAALEMLSDTEQTAVWAAAAAAQDAVASSRGGRQLARMQLGLATAQQEQQPLLLVTFTVGRKERGTAHQEGAAAARLSGPMRVQLLSGLASLAGVRRLAVGLTRVQSDQHAAAPAVQHLTFTVQFGSDSTAAAAFMATCSSMETLADRWAALQLLLAQGSTKTATQCSENMDTPGEQQQQQQQRLGDADVAQCQPSAMTLSQIYTVTAALQDLHAPQQQHQGQGGVVMQENCSSSSSEGSLAHTTPSSADQLQTGCSITAVAASVSTNIAQPTSSEPPRAELAVPGNTAVQQQQHETLAGKELAAAAAAAPALTLPYAHYSLVLGDGRPVERPDKHPFALTRVIYDPRELLSDSVAVWYQFTDLPLRWRQTTSEVHLQLLNIPKNITSCKQLLITLQPYSIKVQDRATGEVYLEGEFARGVVPEDSTWTLSKPSSSSSRLHLSVSSTPAPKPTTVAGLPAAFMSLDTPADCQAIAEQQQQQQYGEGRLQLLLAKMNLELYERPWHHSSSWWPQLFIDDPCTIAWDDDAKDYSELPPAIAAEHAAAAAVDEQQRAADAARRECRAKLQALLDNHKRRRQERLNELRAAAWRRIGTGSMAG